MPACNMPRPLKVSKPIALARHWLVHCILPRQGWRLDRIRRSIFSSRRRLLARDACRIRNEVSSSYRAGFAPARASASEDEILPRMETPAR
jgi:hypothetical protein